MSDEMTARGAWLGAIYVECVSVSAPYRLRGHGHDEPHLCLVLDGILSELDRSRQAELAAGTLRVSPAGDQHDLRFGRRGARCLVALVRPDLLDDGPEGLAPRDRLYTREPWLAGRAIELAAELTRGQRASPILAESAALEIFAQASRPRRRRDAPRPPAWLEEIRDLLRELGATASLERLARHCGRHRAHIAREFRRHFGCSVGDYISSLRVNRARDLLLHTRLPLARVAYRAGFADQSHMTRSMKRRLGTTPGVLRASGASGATIVQDSGDVGAAD